MEKYLSSVIKGGYLRNIKTIMKIKVNVEGLFYNNSLIKFNSTRNDIIKHFGEPNSQDPVNGLPHFRYDDLGIGVFFNDNLLWSITVDYSYQQMNHSPKNCFCGTVEICGTIVNKDFNIDSFMSLITNNNLPHENCSIVGLDFSISYLEIKPHFYGKNESMSHLEIRIDEV